jgi:hypothetical protein
VSDRGARRLYGQFREERPGRTKRVPFKVPKAVAVIGHVEFIGYATTHRGKTHLYLHEFAEGSRPMMAAGPKRNQLLLVGGRYHFTARGIVDLDSSGREVREGAPRYVVKLTGRRR